jgi:hypothetical protein
MRQLSLKIGRAARGGSLVLALVACTTTARGQARPAATGTSSPDKSPDVADAWFEKGSAAFDAGRLEEARELFAKAWAAKKTHDIAANLGIVEKKLGKPRDAAEHIAAALRLLPPTERDAVRKALQGHLAQVRPLVAALTIEVSVEGARVFVGEREVGTSPLAVDVFADPGRVVVRAKRDGYRDAEQTIEATKGSAQAVTLSMEAMPTSVPTATATASATVTPVAPRSKVPAYVMSGVGVASLIAGGVLLGVALGSEGELQKKSADIKAGKVGCPGDVRCADMESAARAGDTMSRAGVGLLIGGAVIGAVAGAYLLWPTPQQKQGALRFVPAVSGQGGGVLVTGRF